MHVLLTEGLGEISQLREDKILKVLQWVFGQDSQPTLANINLLLGKFSLL